MVDKLVPVALLSLMLFGILPASAENGKAPCGSFQKLPNGTWNVVKPIKIEHGTTSATLKAGDTIKPGTHVTGVDLYAALQKNCQQMDSPPPISNGRQ
jgi:hypothetical protein